MSSILYYITGHGYGHAVRSSQVIGSLKKTSPDLKIHVRTTAPEWLFLDRAFQSRQAIDVGILQKDSLEMDLDGTLRACQSLHDSVPRLIEQEIDFIKQHQIRLILGDIPPLCFEIAMRASVDSVAIANFTWSEIYRAYIKNYPGFISLIEEMETFYRNATLALTLPYPCGMDVFPRQETIPWIARTSLLTKARGAESISLTPIRHDCAPELWWLGVGTSAVEQLEGAGRFFLCDDRGNQARNQTMCASCRKPSETMKIWFGL